MKQLPYILYSIILSSILSSCNKFLDAKPDKSLVIPTSVSDLQSLLDNTSRMNGTSPCFDEVSSDNYFVLDASYSGLADFERYAYTWQINGEDLKNYPDDWSLCYDPIFIANTVLDNLQKVEINNINRESWNNAKGSALFFRSHSFFKAALIFANTYDEATAKTDNGIPIRLGSDFNVPTTRATLAETFDRIILDLKESSTLLPDVWATNQARPSRTASYALLSRVYLYMRNYDSAYKYSNLSLQLYDKLLDYNDGTWVTPTANSPFKRLSPEVIFYYYIQSYTFLTIYPNPGFVDTTLRLSYAANDLRSVAYFRLNSSAKQYQFKGSYEGTASNYFTGIATDEIYLTRAECLARMGDKDKALLDLNTLLKTRWTKNQYTQITAPSAEDALKLILQERRKELMFRGTRWMDIKRLNKEGQNITLRRNVNGVVYTLPPNSRRYALPIPFTIITLTGMQQNQY